MRLFLDQIFRQRKVGTKDVGFLIGSDCQSLEFQPFEWLAQNYKNTNITNLLGALVPCKYVSNGACCEC